MPMPELTSDMNNMAGLSPKKVAAVAILRLYEKYFDNMAANKDVNIDRMTAAILISCPENDQRERLWKLYRDTRDKDNNDDQLTASVVAVGAWYQYMSGAMGLTESSTMGG